ncbi:hypothetical protein TTHERM_01347890, partial (macronuclear) [Tetrahymena thermophila SB210]
LIIINSINCIKITYLLFELMSVFSEDKFKITRRVPALQNMKSIDHITKVYINNKQYQPISTKVKKYLKLAEHIQRNSHSSERRFQVKLRNVGDSNENDEDYFLYPKNKQSLKENQLQNIKNFKRSVEKQSSLTDDTSQQGRQKAQTAYCLNSISNQESYDSSTLKSYQTSDDSKFKQEVRNSLPNSPLLQPTVVQSNINKQKLKLESFENEQQQENLKSNNTSKDQQNSLEDFNKYQLVGVRKNLMLQRAQLQRLDQFNRKDESNNFIQEEEEDDDDILFHESFERKNQQKQKQELETGLPQENWNELSIIKSKGIQQNKTPLSQLNIQKFSRNHISNSQAGSRNRVNQSNDLASILQELDQEDSKHKIVLPQNFTFNNIKRNTVFKKSAKQNDLMNSLKQFRQSISPQTENTPQPIRQLSQNSLGTANLQKVQKPKVVSTFSQSQNLFNIKQSNLKVRSQQQDINYIMNQNFLQDIKDLKKKLQKQSFVLKALNI